MGETDIQTYYDANTRRFLVVGGSGEALAIHRPLWADEITSTAAAAAHINDVILEFAARHLPATPTRVCDLGCGVGGSVFHLAATWQATQFLGVTISAVQRDTASTEADRRVLGERCTFVQADFNGGLSEVQAKTGAVDLIIAIESHVHATSAASFLETAAGLLAPGGLLLIVDDMLATPEPELSPSDQTRLHRFKAGWRLGHVPDHHSLCDNAATAGLQHLEFQDLTPLIRLNRLRDLALHLVAPAADRLGLNRWPVFGNMIGGDALTRLYRRGAMRYTVAAFRRLGDDRATD